MFRLTANNYQKVSKQMCVPTSNFRNFELSICLYRVTEITAEKFATFYRTIVGHCLIIDLKWDRYRPLFIFIFRPLLVLRCVVYLNVDIKAWSGVSTLRTPVRIGTPKPFFADFHSLIGRQGRKIIKIKDILLNY